MIRRLLPHLSIILSIMMLVLFIIDSINSAMGFLRGPEFRTLLLALIVASLATAIASLVGRRSHD